VLVEAVRIAIPPLGAHRSNASGDASHNRASVRRGVTLPTRSPSSEAQRPRRFNQ
jgi:hypothetical protein